MLTFYVCALVLGGALVSLSALSGGADVDFDVDADIDMDVDADVDVDADADVDADSGADASSLDISGAIGAWLPIKSVRFWTFFLAFGGLTGTVLTILGSTSSLGAALGASSVGYVAGATVSHLVKRVARRAASTTVGQNDFLGAHALVVLPIGAQRAGQVRVRVKGRDVDARALVEGDEIPVAEQVLVYDVRDDGVLMVSPLEQDAR